MNEGKFACIALFVCLISYTQGTLCCFISEQLLKDPIRFLF